MVISSSLILCLKSLDNLLLLLFLEDLHSKFAFDKIFSIASLEFLWLPIIQGLESKIKIENVTSY